MSVFYIHLRSKVAWLSCRTNIWTCCKACSTTTKTSNVVWRCRFANEVLGCAKHGRKVEQRAPSGRKLTMTEFWFMLRQSAPPIFTLFSYQQWQCALSMSLNELLAYLRHNYLDSSMTIIEWYGSANKIWIWSNVLCHPHAVSFDMFDLFTSVDSLY